MRNQTIERARPSGLLPMRLWAPLALAICSACLLLATWETGAANAIGFLPGAAGFDGSYTNADGTPDTQAGSHPFAMTTSIAFATSLDSSGNRVTAGNVKNIEVNLPAGLVGDVTAVPRCSVGQLERQLTERIEETGLCPPDTQIGQLTVYSNNFPGFVYPVYSVVPPPGAVAMFGVSATERVVLITPHVRTGSDYGLSSDIENTTTDAGSIFSSKLTLWGVPADPRHTVQRGAYICFSSGECFVGNQPSGLPPKPFLTLPTSCTGPQATTIAVDTWQEPASFVEDSFLTHDASGNPVGFEGCERLGFDPSIAVQPDTGAADSPAGVHVDVHQPQAGLQDPESIAEADLEKAVVTLPAGTSVNPAGANGLAACSPAQIALSSPGPATCPDAAKVGTVEVDTPILDRPLDGGVYVAEQGNNPFGSLLALYIAVHDPATGVVVKVAGHVVADPQTGQLTTTFDSIPQQPVSDIRLDFFGGARAALVNPDACGSYTTTSQMTPWSGAAAVEPPSAFEVNAGCHGPQFAPSFTAGTINPQAGGFSPLSVTIARSDQDQNFGGITVKTPPGLLGILKSVEQCPEPLASQGTCGPNSLIGRTTASAGAGSDPVGVGGQVFLTGPYKGAPFGLSIVVPAVAGPFNLGTVVVRAAISVDPHTAQITVTSDPLPTILQGIPLLIKKVNVTIDRSRFMFNPTNCEPLSVGGTITSSQGASASVSSHFQAANCAALPFKPSFTASTQASTSKKNGASLDVKVGYPQGAQANIRSVAVTLPKQLPSRLTTIQQACPEATFAANPASCPAGSNIGIATARTPVLANSVTGPAYLVSHGGAAFPDVVLILQGEGVKLELIGSINIKNSITSSAFNAVPDAPISSFELSLPEGPHSGLAAVLSAKAKGSLCGTSLTMPTTLTGQNGAQIKQNTKIAVTGCPKVKKKSKAKKKHHKARAKKGSLGKRP